MDWLTVYMPYVWLAVTVAAAIAEACTAQLVSIWFVVGGVVAAVAAFCGAPLWLQWVLFIGVTLLTLIITRPLVKKALNFKKVDTNADRYIGMRGVVTEAIDNTAGTGLVKVQGSIWTARSVAGEVIRGGADVVVKNIEGVKLMVETAAPKEQS